MTPEERKEAILRIHNQLGWPFKKREEDEGGEVVVDWADKVERAKVDSATHEVVSRKIASLEQARPDRICAVLDFDAFFVSVALLNHPEELKKKPVVICEGECNKTCCTVNYVGRAYGIQKGMPFWMAQKMCQRAREFGMPYTKLELMQKDAEKQKEVSRIAIDIYREYDDTCEPSLQDEAKLELGPYLLKRFGTMDLTRATEVVNEIRRRVFRATQCTLSAGIAPNFLLAKMASEVRKPNNQFALRNEDVSTFLSGMPVGKIPGIGPTKQSQLNKSFQVYTIKDLLEKLPVIMEVGYCPHELLKLAIGWDDERNKPNPLPKQAQKSEGFPRPLSGAALQATFDAFCNEAAKKLTVQRISQKTKRWRTVKMYGKGAELKYQTASYLPYTESEKSEKGKKQVSIRSAEDLKKLLSRHLPTKAAVISLGVYITGLEETQSNTIESYGLKRKREY
jgi:DNA polymerase-4